MPQKNSEFETHVAEATAHYRAGRPTEAAAAYQAALQIVPNHPGALHNLGVITASQGDHHGALGLFDAALTSQPQYGSAHYNRAVALQALERPREAIDAFARALAVEPDNYAAHRAIAFALLAQGRRDRAMDHFARTYELRRGEDRTGMAARSLTHSNRCKLRHDAEQFRYIASTGRDPRRFEALARSYEAIGEPFPEAVAPLSEADFELLGESYNTPLYLADAPELADGAVRARPDHDALVRQFESGPVGVIPFDDLLTERAHATLRRYLLESTIWHDFSHIQGFVASYLEDGLACPLLLQIVDELRRAFPELLGEHPLRQAWAFKAVEPKGAVDVHADDAALSINFWMTPTAANLNPGGGGLGVCLVPPPADWGVKDYNHDLAHTIPFLEQNAGRRLLVPYRDNRAVLFESRLLHYSDAPAFAENYQNHRINLTFLFGAGRAAGRRKRA